MKCEIIIVGAGAAGLMAARELGKARKKVIILEARNRIGGRIWALQKDEFGYDAQAGAEYVHGDSPIMKSLSREADMTLIQTQGDMWNSYGGEGTIKSERDPNQKEMHKAPGELKNQYRIKEGHGAMLKFLESECGKNGTKIELNKIVREVEINNGKVNVHTADGDDYETEKVIVTVPLPVLADIKFIPAIPEKLEAARKMGYGGVIKILLKFKSRWWVNAFGKDFGEMDFMFSNEEIRIWWTQYPDLIPVLTGWLAGPKSAKLIDSSDAEIIDAGIRSLAN